MCKPCTTVYGCGLMGHATCVVWLCDDDGVGSCVLEHKATPYHVLCAGLENGGELQNDIALIPLHYLFASSIIPKILYVF